MRFPLFGLVLVTQICFAGEPRVEVEEGAYFDSTSREVVTNLIGYHCSNTINIQKTDVECVGQRVQVTIYATCPKGDTKLKTPLKYSIADENLKRVAESCGKLDPLAIGVDESFVYRPVGGITMDRIIRALEILEEKKPRESALKTRVGPAIGSPGGSPGTN